MSDVDALGRMEFAIMPTQSRRVHARRELARASARALKLRSATPFCTTTSFLCDERHPRRRVTSHRHRHADGDVAKAPRCRQPDGAEGDDRALPAGRCFVERPAVRGEYDARHAPRSAPRARPMNPAFELFRCTTSGRVRADQQPTSSRRTRGSRQERVDVAPDALALRTSGCSAALSRSASSAFAP